jgi:hypothetical protein
MSPDVINVWLTRTLYFKSKKGFAKEDKIDPAKQDLIMISLELIKITDIFSVTVNEDGV